MGMAWVPQLAARMRARLTAVHVLPSPNIWQWPELYAVENRAQDSTGEIWRALRADCDWRGLDVVDVGCGDGYHLPVFAEDAASVTGVVMATLVWLFRATIRPARRVPETEAPELVGAAR